MNGPYPKSAPALLQEGLRVGTCLGRGGMSQVLAATTGGGTPVAVKVSNPAVVDPVAARALIQREYAFLSALSHRNIVSVLGLTEIDHADAGKGPGIVMEYVSGGDLVSLAGSRPGHWLPVAVQLADALVYLHAAGFVHRDIKARNVLLRSGDVPCLIDFSLAASIGDRAPLGGGTAAYQSASRRRGAPADVDDDVHGFAVLVYELWTGALPFGRDPSLDVLEDAGAHLRMLETGGADGLRSLAGLVSTTLVNQKKRGRGGIEPFSDALELALKR